MRKLHGPCALVLLLISYAAIGQAIDSAAFFRDEKPFDMTLTSDLKNLVNKKMQKEEQPASITMQFADGNQIKEDVRINTRGKFRLENCHMPPIAINFKKCQLAKNEHIGKIETGSRLRRHQ